MPGSVWLSNGKWMFCTGVAPIQSPRAFWTLTPRSTGRALSCQIPSSILSHTASAATSLMLGAIFNVRNALCHLSATHHLATLL